MAQHDDRFANNCDHSAIAAIQESIDETKELLKQVHKILVGNGDPTVGVVYRLAKLEEAHKWSPGKRIMVGIVGGAASIALAPAMVWGFSAIAKVVAAASK